MGNFPPTDLRLRLSPTNSKELPFSPVRGALVVLPVQIRALRFTEKRLA